MCRLYRKSIVDDKKLFKIWLLLIPVLILKQIQWNPTFFITSLINGISLFTSFKFTQTRVLEKLLKRSVEKEIVNSI